MSPVTKEFVVRWEIDATATSHLAAALYALEVMQDPASLATCFSVTDGETEVVVDAESGEVIG